ncbi:MAG: GMC oxidoreductase [Candidatus Eiseniibacteriota bacterium]
MNIVVVGSGASAVHFARSALSRGHEVVLLDVGRERPQPVRPGDGFEDLKKNLEDPVAHFLGSRFESVIYPGAESEYYGFPPNKSYVFEGVDAFDVRATGFSPLVSFARGGLAEAWTAGVFPFNAGELADFPFTYDDLAPYYELVAERIGVSGAVDDITEHMPAPKSLQPALTMDEHSRVLLERYAAKRSAVRGRGFVVGRSRVATLTRELHGRPACDYLGRCLMGCPIDSLYTPLATLGECLREPRFRYRPGLHVLRFRTHAGRVTSVIAARVDGTGVEEIPADALVLGAGTLASSRIFLESWRRERGEVIRLTGLMDNRQVLMPFLNLGMIRRPHDPRTYQYHQLLIGMTADDPREYVHGIVTTLKTAQIHPIVQSVPFDLRTALHVFRNVHAALGLVNVNFWDRRRDDCFLTLDARDTGGPESEAPPLRVHYEPPPGERARISSTLRRFRGALRKLGCVVPPGMSHVRPMGASVHYAGTLPMTREERPLTTTPEGRSRDFENLWIVDGSTFPFLPAKNLTLTLMANAARIADQSF